MKRLHIHIGVERLEDSVRFYSAFFGVDPVTVKPDYAKWMLDDPRINFAVSTRAGKKGVDHLGIQLDNAAELERMREHMSAADIATYDDGEVVCCYAQSEKSWVEDPSGLAWETYHTMGKVQVYAQTTRAACCTSDTKQQETCCPE